MNIKTLPSWALPASVGTIAFGCGVAAGWALKRYKDNKKTVTKPESTQLEFDFDDVTAGIDKAVGRMEYVTREAKLQGERLVESIREMAILKDIPVESKFAHPSNSMGNDPRNIVLEGDNDIVEKPAEEAQVVHIFASDNTDENWDYEEETSKRRPNAPYIIHRDEFFNDEMGYGDVGGQRCFTWYEGDGILVDERDTPIYNHLDRVGNLRFGHGSQDPNIVYIRNEEEEEEYEIVHDDGSYQVNVLGEELGAEYETEDIRHSRRPGKFRDE